MKKLALVLGSLLVVGTAASAKEVVPAPVVVPEKVVEIVEKPVIVYRDREVAPAWRPNGSVNVEARFYGPVEDHKLGSETWKGDDYRTSFRTTSKINFTEKQSLKIHTRNAYGLTRRNNAVIDKHEYVELTHGYNFGNLGTSKVAARLETTLSTEGGKYLQVKPVFDFSEYFFKNDYVKATALEIAPLYRYSWTRNDMHSDRFALYANMAFDLPFGVDFQAEFDNLFSYDKANRTAKHAPNQDLTSRTGKVEMTLGKTFPLYKEGKHNLAFRLEGIYETYWAYSKGNGELSIKEAGTQRENSAKQERWGGYSAQFKPHFRYNFQATEFVKLYTTVGANYTNRTGEVATSQRHNAKHWRWSPEVRVGFTASF